VIGTHEEFARGVVVYQVTDDPAPKHNIYCEFPWCPPTSECFVFARVVEDEHGRRWEYVACDFGTWRQRVIGRGEGATMAGGRFYYRRPAGRDRSELVRVDLATGAESLLALPPVAVQMRGCLSPDERYLAHSYAVSYRPQRFAIALVDLATGEERILHEDPFTCNTHLQFHRAHGRQLLVQHNRGCRFAADGKREVLVGPEGCTLFLLSVPDGQVTPLPVGPPHTASCSGHETWLGTTDQVLLTLNRQEDYDHGNGPIVIADRHGAREIAAPWEMNHIGAPDSGRLFCADTYSPDAVIVGSPVTGKVAEVCPARSSYTRSMPDNHPHAYLSPDLRWAIFNSDRTGTPQLYVAAIPPDLVAELETP
jgi:hypothetical protein